MSVAGERRESVGAAGAMHAEEHTGHRAWHARGVRTMNMCTMDVT